MISDNIHRVDLCIQIYSVVVHIYNEESMLSVHLSYALNFSGCVSCGGSGLINFEVLMVRFREKEAI